MKTVQLRRWTRHEYDRMIDAGVLTPHERVELIDGEIVTMPPQKSRHATAIRLVEIALTRVFGEGFDVRTQLPLALDQMSEPEPDVAVVVGAPRDYRDHHPSTAVLIVEVADATVVFDRTVKAGLYARAGIADYWLLDLTAGVLEVHREPVPSNETPSGWRYATIQRHDTSAHVAPLARPDSLLAVSELMP